MDAAVEADSSVVGSGVGVSVSVAEGDAVGCVPAGRDSPPPRQPVSNPPTVIVPLYVRHARRETPEPLSESSDIGFRLA
jgi:hypothetical protein